MCRGENTMKEWKQSKKAQLVWAVEDNEEHTFKTKTRTCRSETHRISPDLLSTEFALNQFFPKRPALVGCGSIYTAVQWW